MVSVGAVLRVGDRVAFDGDEYLVVGLAGSAVRLRADASGEQVVLARHLMAAADFAVLDSPGLSAVEPFGLLDALPAGAERWRDHVIEAQTGLPPGAGPGAVPRPGYDPHSTTLAERQHVKATELGIGYRTIERKRAHFEAGSVDVRRVAGRCSPTCGQRVCGARRAGWSA
ncbi:hypothetical protein AB0K14_38180 [Actinosynnema sp. NPDC050801]|uniref:hypothetical protein n=1 Tax=unclassified Actinosynnema TaxID=2637065 RepID=UPI0033F5B82B